MNERIEELFGRVLRRTGWVTPLRACPAHDVALELCFNETDFSKWGADSQALYGHDENRLCWRCDRCVGTWSENFFMYRPDIRSAMNAAEYVSRLVLTCPVCGSRRLGHDCVPACCGEHSCRDCHATFEVSARIIKPGKTAPLNESPDNVFYGPVAERFGDPASFEYPIAWSGCRADFRRCGKCGEPRELLIVGEKMATTDSTRVAWHCAACKSTETEGNFHRVRIFFEADAEAACDCPTCGFRGRLVTRADGAVICDRCNATAEIAIREAQRRRPNRSGAKRSRDGSQ